MQILFNMQDTDVSRAKLAFVCMKHLELVAILVMLDTVVRRATAIEFQAVTFKGRIPLVPNAIHSQYL